MKTLLLVVTLLSTVSSAAFAGENKAKLSALPTEKKGSLPIVVTVAEGVVGVAGTLGVGSSVEAEREFNFVRFELARKKIIRDSQAQVLKLEASIRSAGGPNTLAGSLLVRNLEAEKNKLYKAKMELFGSRRSSGPFKSLAGVSLGLSLAAFSDLGLKLYYGQKGKDVGNFALDDFAADLASVVTDRTSAQKQQSSTRNLAKDESTVVPAEEVSVK